MRRAKRRRRRGGQTGRNLSPNRPLIEASPYSLRLRAIALALRAGSRFAPGAPASIKLSRHPSSARRGIFSVFKEAYGIHHFHVSEPF